MKTVKIMAIIGMVFFPICLILTMALLETDMEAAAGWGIYAAMYGIGFAITAFVQANKRLKEAAG